MKWKSKTGGGVARLTQASRKALFVTVNVQTLQGARMFSQYVIGEVDAKKWWAIMASHASEINVDTIVEMGQFLSKLHGVPDSSASIERTILRNKLGAGKVGKIVKINRHFNRKNRTERC